MFRQGLLRAGASGGAELGARLGRCGVGIVTLTCAFAILNTAPCLGQTTRPALNVPAWVAIEANVPYDKHEATVLDVMWPKGEPGAAAGTTTRPAATAAVAAAAAPSSKRRPGVVVFHGGGWIRSTKETTMNALCLPYLRQGFAVCNVEYRVAPQGKAPAAVNDALTASKWFFDHADKYNVDPKRIVITGASAGGHLALMAGMSDEAAGLGPTVRAAAIVNGYGITDVADLLDGPHRQAWAVEWLPPDAPARSALAKRVSPMTYVRKDLPPILTVQGANDRTVPLEHGVKLTKALKDAGADAEMVTVPGAGHGFSPQQWVGVNEKIFEFLRKRGVLD